MRNKIAKFPDMDPIIVLTPKVYELYKEKNGLNDEDMNGLRFLRNPPIETVN